MLKRTITLGLILMSVYASEVHKRTYEILEGDNLLVICNISDTPDTDVYWTKNDTKHPFKMEGKRLEILNINRNFSGDYICHALNTSYPPPDYNETDVNRTIQVINVDVQYPGEIDEFSITKNVVVEYEMFNITCDFQGHPNPNWSLGQVGVGYILQATLPALVTTFMNATCSDTGVWECTGANRLNNGVNVTRQQHVEVLCSPRPTFQGNEYIVEVRAGRRANFTMNLISNPAPTFTWTKDDGTDISAFTRQENFDNKTILTFDSVTIPAFGNYTLKMQNPYGTYYAHYQLKPSGAPETPTNFGFYNVTSNSVTVYWTSGFDMGSQQHFIVFQMRGNVFMSVSSYLYDNSTNHGINNSWTYEVTGLQSSTFYNLTVVAENDHHEMSRFAQPYATFTTYDLPPYTKPPRKRTAVIVGSVCGSIGFIALIAILVYILKYRRLRTSYLDISEKTRKI